MYFLPPYPFLLSILCRTLLTDLYTCVCVGFHWDMWVNSSLDVFAYNQKGRCRSKFFSFIWYSISINNRLGILNIDGNKHSLGYSELKSQYVLSDEKKNGISSQILWLESSFWYDILPNSSETLFPLLSNGGIKANVTVILSKFNKIMYIKTLGTS